MIKPILTRNFLFALMLGLVLLLPNGIAFSQVETDTEQGQVIELETLFLFQGLNF